MLLSSSSSSFDIRSQDQSSAAPTMTVCRIQELSVREALITGKPPLVRASHRHVCSILLLSETDLRGSAKPSLQTRCRTSHRVTPLAGRVCCLTASCIALTLPQWQIASALCFLFLVGCCAEGKRASHEVHARRVSWVMNAIGTTAACAPLMRCVRVWIYS
jgi:hypothetical protein